MTCSLCAKDSKYDLDISRDRFPRFRQVFTISLCDEHKVKVVELLDALVFQYYSTIMEKKPE